MTERDSGKAEAPGAVKMEVPGAAKTEALDREKMDAPAKSRILAKLFWSTLYLSAFTFGGGYVIVTLMKKKFVDEYGWIKEDEMLVKRLMIQKAGKKVILMDSSKCGKILPYTFGNVEDADYIVSDGRLPEELMQRAERAGTRIL